MTGYTDDYYLTDAVDPAAVAIHARRSAELSGNRQRIHDHPAGQRCQGRCEVVA